MLHRAIVKKPSEGYPEGLTTRKEGKPDYKKALEQHTKYCDALRKAGLDVTVLDPHPDFPDSPFIEDTAVLTDHCAIITRGQGIRAGEERSRGL